MQHHPKRILARTLSFWMALGVLLLSTASAQSGGPYEIRSSTVDGGGISSSTGGAYELSGTIGQWDAGVLRGGRYGVSGGFWRVAIPPLVAALATWALIVLGLFLGVPGSALLRRRTQPDEATRSHGTTAARCTSS